MKIVGAITVMDEVTFPLSIQKMKAQTRKMGGLMVVSQVRPMRSAFNRALDLAMELNADVLFHIAADVILRPFALEELMKKLRPDVFMVTGAGRDAVLGETGFVPGGNWIFDMRILKDTFRFGTGIHADMNFVRMVESRTGLKREFVGKTLSDHHPIWTPRELWMKLRFSLPKYLHNYKSNARVIQAYETFFAREGATDPDNKTLKIGQAFFDIMRKDMNAFVLQDKDPVALEPEWQAFAGPFGLTGGEFWAMPEYRDMAQKLIKTKPQAKIISLAKRAPAPEAGPLEPEPARSEAVAPKVKIAVKKPDLDVLMLTRWDWANTGYRFYRCLKRLGLKVVFFKGEPHPFNYPEQAAIHPALRDGAVTSRHPIVVQAPELKPLLESAKVIHFLAGTFIETGADLSGKTCIIQYAGSTLRLEPEKVTDFFNPIVDMSLCQFPSLMGLGAKDETLMYYPVDTDEIRPNYMPEDVDHVRIGHFPSKPLNKGTALILGVIDELAQDPDIGPKFEYVGERALVKGRSDAVDWLDNLERMRGCDVIIETIQPVLRDRAFGEWGNTALEAAALGKVVITNSIHQALYQQEYGECALQIANDAESLKETLRRILSLKPIQLVELKARTRRWAEEKHGMAATANRLWSRVYSRYFEVKQRPVLRSIR